MIYGSIFLHNLLNYFSKLLENLKFKKIYKRKFGINYGINYNKNI